MSRKKQPNPTFVDCPSCGALSGAWCRGKKMCRARRDRAKALLKQPPRRRSGGTGYRLQYTRVGPSAKRQRPDRTVTTYYVCPVCGGPHARSECDAKNAQLISAENPTHPLASGTHFPQNDESPATTGLNVTTQILTRAEVAQG